MPRLLSTLLLAVVLSSKCLAQSLPAAFEAYSLRALPQGAKLNVDAAASLDPSRPADSRAPSLLIVDVSLFDLVVIAYEIKDAGKQPLLMKQLPDWAVTEHFHLSARLPPDTTLGAMRQMLQALLRERFALAVHEETHEAPVYRLETEPKHGPHLQPHSAACEPPNAKENHGDAASQEACGAQTQFSSGSVAVRFTGMTLNEIADQVGGFGYFMGGLRYGPVVNSTGLQGRFDAALTFMPLMQANVAGGTPLQEALRQQMGLVLRKGIAPLSLLKIDGVQPPLLDK